MTDIRQNAAALQPKVTPAAAQPPEPGLDEVMLAMDVVDTLRHEQDVISRELHSDARDAAFVARVRQIYAGQGIAVSDEIIRQGVEALKQDRFTYVPPKRTFAVRLAEIYIDRWRWFRRSVFTSIGVGTLWVIATLPGQIADHFAYGKFEDQVSALQDEAVRRQSELTSQQRRLEQLDPEAQPITEAAVTERQTKATQVLAEATATTQALAALSPMPADQFAADPDAAARLLSTDKTRLDELSGQLSEVRSQLGEATELQSIEQQFRVGRSQLVGLALGETVAAEMTRLDGVAEQALRLGDSERARTAVGKFTQAAAQVDLAYELRIVNRPGVQSGVRRKAAGQDEGRSHYVIVEAVDADGQILKLPVTSEETQQVETVSRFAIRVPQSVYDQVRADKQDNGLIDAAVVGTKIRGELEPRYTVEIAGGTITDW
ncbi:MAG: hypothetical protein IPK97_11480 [Ahniella sp.]|nr:hypothetical protein [Ahniella sp.]